MDPIEPPRLRELPDPVWPSTEWPAGPVAPPVIGPIDSEPLTMVPPTKSGTGWTTFLALLGGVLLGTGVTLGVLGIIGVIEPDIEPVATPAPIPTTTTIVASAAAGSVAEVADISVPSIVEIQILDETNTILGGGSGVVYDTAGHVLTNNHVVAEAASLAVVYSDGIIYPAELVGTDPLTDIAVILTTRQDVTPITLGSVSDLRIGERAVAIGNPLGLLGGPSVTTGIVSATDRPLAVDATTVLYGLVQTDAPITRGSSGGALLNESGELIGITTAIGVSDVGAEGLGFAVPVDMAVSVANDLIADGQVRHGLIGIEGSSTAEVDGDASIPIGVLVVSLSPDGSYETAGGLVDDVILRLDGEPILSIETLLARLRLRREGDDVDLDVLRGSDEIEITITLGPRTG